MDKVLKVILIGAGNRGETYTDIMAQMSDKFKVIAVAEPIESRRNNIQKKHQIADDLCFEDWKPLLDAWKDRGCCCYFNDGQTTSGTDTESNFFAI